MLEQAFEMRSLIVMLDGIDEASSSESECTSAVRGSEPLAELPVCTAGSQHEASRGGVRDEDSGLDGCSLILVKQDFHFSSISS